MNKKLCLLKDIALAISFNLLNDSNQNMENLCTGINFFDVGCDHGKLILALIKASEKLNYNIFQEQEQKNKAVNFCFIASDISRSSLNKAEILFQNNKNLAYKPYLLCVNGIPELNSLYFGKKLQQEDSLKQNIYIIAGMGAEEIIDILEAYNLDRDAYFILQPTNSISILRTYLIYKYRFKKLSIFDTDYFNTNIKNYYVEKMQDIEYKNNTFLKLTENLHEFLISEDNMLYSIFCCKLSPDAVNKNLNFFHKNSNSEKLDKKLFFYTYLNTLTSEERRQLLLPQEFIKNLSKLESQNFFKAHDEYKKMLLADFIKRQKKYFADISKNENLRKLFSCVNDYKF